VGRVPRNRLWYVDGGLYLRPLLEEYEDKDPRIVRLIHSYRRDLLLIEELDAECFELGRT